MSLELIDTDDVTCPVELVKIPVPKCDPDFDTACTGKQHLPYERIAYDKNSGQSPNMPRRQVCCFSISYSYIYPELVNICYSIYALHEESGNIPFWNH